MSVDAARRWWPLAAGVLLGILVALSVSLLGSTSRKAEATVVISSPAGPAAVRLLLPNLRELARSGVVAGNVKSTLRLPESAEDVRRHLDASVRPGSEVIAISATDPHADKARQLAQEAAVVFAPLVDSRFGTGPAKLHAAVLDSAHVLSGANRHFLRNALIGALVGWLLGSTAMFVRARGPAPTEDERSLMKRERLVEQRLKAVTKRERAIARRAGELAARERQLAERQEELEEQPAPAPAPTPTPKPEPRAEPEQEPELATAPPPVAAEPVRGSLEGSWNLEVLERLVDVQTDATPEQVAEWREYLFYLREHAYSDGSLPSNFDGLLEDIFGSLRR